jgi:hypothetical protein
MILMMSCALVSLWWSFTDEFIFVFWFLFLCAPTPISLSQRHEHEESHHHGSSSSSRTLLEFASPDLMASFDEHTWLLTVRSLDARQLGAFMRTCLETLLYQVRAAFGNRGGGLDDSNHGVI